MNKFVLKKSILDSIEEFRKLHSKEEFKSFLSDLSLDLYIMEISNQQN